MEFQCTKRIAYKNIFAEYYDAIEKRWNRFAKEENIEKKTEKYLYG